MTEVSATLTGGIGSERHNHDLEYRESLDHTSTANCPEAIIELIPYDKSYKAQINDLMKPYIDAYNAEVEARYQAAWNRYNTGERKSKPKKRDYQMMDYDYFEAHKDDEVFNPHTNSKEKIPSFRSWIVGLGDITDRQTERITREQAEPIFRQFVQKFQEKFPHFHLLGATMHLDEKGFFHLHLDYKPVMAHAFSKGLQATTSQDTILESMGYEPEQSFINGHDKAPILFNALRNRMYYILEDAMAANGLRLQYGVTEQKQPGKDSGTHMDMNAWQATQDGIRKLQHQKNIMLDAIQGGEVTPEGLGTVLFAGENITQTMDKIMESPWHRKSKSKIVEFRLLDQLKSFVTMLMESFHFVFAQLERAIGKYNDAEDRAEIAEKEVARLRPIEEKYKALTVSHHETQGKLQRATTEANKLRAFLRSRHSADGKTLEEEYQEATRNERIQEK